MATQLNQDRIHTADRGTLSDPKQSAGFISDPMLRPVSSSSAPHPILPDPSPSDNPEHFDPSTRHPNTDYHPDKKLSKKKRAKKLGVVSAADHANHQHHPVPSSYIGNDTFSSHEKQALERQHKRDEVLAARQQHESEEGSEEDMDEDDEEGDYEHEGGTRSDAELRQSKQQHHSEQVTGKEGDKGKGTSVSGSRSSAATTNKSISEKSDANAKNTSNKEKEQGHDKGAEAHPSLLTRASDAASGLASKVMHTGVVSSLMNKVGLAGGKTEQEHATDKGKTEKSEPTNEDMEAAGK